jgi:hypothetical protein
MNQTTSNDVIMWLLLMVATTFSIASIIITYKLVQKFDDLQTNMVEILEILSAERIKMVKDLEELKRRVRMNSNEIKKENNGRNNKG